MNQSKVLARERAAFALLVDSAHGPDALITWIESNWGRGASREINLTNRTSMSLRGQLPELIFWSTTPNQPGATAVVALQLNFIPTPMKRVKRSLEIKILQMARLALAKETA